MEGGGRVESGTETESNALGQEARRYDSKEGIGRVESGTEAENNAGAVFCHSQVFHTFRVQLIFLGLTYLVNNEANR